MPSREQRMVSLLVLAFAPSGMWLPFLPPPHQLHCWGGGDMHMCWVPAAGPSTPGSGEGEPGVGWEGSWARGGEKAVPGTSGAVSPHSKTALCVLGCLAHCRLQGESPERKRKQKPGLESCANLGAPCHSLTSASPGPHWTGSVRSMRRGQVGVGRGSQGGSV